MKRAKRVVSFVLIFLLCFGTDVSAFADTQSTQAAYTVQYLQVEQMVLNNNLQVGSNELTIGSMDNENKLKKKYDEISDVLSQTSASMNAIINNPQSTTSLKAVAQGTNVTLQALLSLLDLQEDVSDDDYELTELQVDLSNGQLVRSAQSIFSVYYQLQYNIQDLTNKRIVLENAKKIAQAKYDAQLGTYVDVLDAENTLTALDNSIIDLQNQSKSIGYQMNQLLGHSYNDSITFGTMPQPDTVYAEKINLKNDTVSAQAASWKVKIYAKERSLLGDDTRKNRDQRQIKSNAVAMENENIGASLEKQYDAIKKQQAALSLEQQKLQNAKVQWDQAQQKYNAGVLPAFELIKVKNDYLAESTAVKTVSSTLFWNIESYKWIVKGLPAS